MCISIGAQLEEFDSIYVHKNSLFHLTLLTRFKNVYETCLLFYLNNDDI